MLGTELRFFTRAASDLNRSAISLALILILFVSQVTPIADTRKAVALQDSTSSSVFPCTDCVVSGCCYHWLIFVAVETLTTPLMLLVKKPLWLKDSPSLQGPVNLCPSSLSFLLQPHSWSFHLAQPFSQLTFDPYEWPLCLPEKAHLSSVPNIFKTWEIVSENKHKVYAQNKCWVIYCMPEKCI